MSDPASNWTQRPRKRGGLDVEAVRTRHRVKGGDGRGPGDREPGHLARGATRITVRAELPGDGLPVLLTVDETADLLRTTRKAVYSMVGRGQLSGVTRIGRRLLIRTRDLLSWLDHNCAPSP